MTPKDISYLPYYLSPTEVDNIKDNLKRLRDDERGGLRPKKLKGFDTLYSIRLNKAERLLLIKKSNQWLAVEIVYNHDYDKAKCLQIQVLKRILGADCEVISIEWEDISEEEIALQPFASWAPAYLQGHKPILLDDNQSMSLQLQQPGLIIGPPGSGKTSVSMAILQNYILQSEKPNPTILYIVPTPKLKEELKKLWDANPLADRAHVIFKTYVELIPNTTQPIITQAQFKTWLIEAIKPCRKDKQYNNFDWRLFCQQSEEVRFEFSLIKAMGNDAYQKAGVDACCFYDFKQLLQQLFKRYRAHLKLEQYIDLYLSEIDESIRPELTLIDEGQSYFPHQHLQMSKLSAHNQALYICVDKEQCINTARLIEGFIRQLYYHLNQKSLNPHFLTYTYRCPEKVVELANTLMDYGNAHEAPKSSHHYKAMTSRVDYPGECYFYSNIDVHSQSYLQSLCESADTLVIVPHAGFKSPNFDKIKTSLVLTAEEALGFDAENVIIIDPFSTLDAQNFAKRTPSNPPTLKEWSWFRSLFVAFTRAGRRLVIVQSQSNVHHQVQDIVTRLQNLCPKEHQQTLLQPDEKANEKWLLRYKQALANGLLKLAEDIRHQHPHLPYNDIAIPGPVQSPALPITLPKSQTANIPKLTEEQILGWCKKGQEEIKKQIGLHHENKLGPLFLWIKLPNNIRALEAVVSKNALFKNQLKNILLMKPWEDKASVIRCFLYELIASEQSHSLLNMLISILSAKELNEINIVLENTNPMNGLTYIDTLLLKSCTPIVETLFHKLSDKAWLNRLTLKTEHGCLFNVITFDDVALARLGKLLNQNNRWDILTEEMPKLIQFLEWVSRQDTLSYEATLMSIIVDKIYSNPGILFQLYNFKNIKVCLLSLMIDYFLNENITTEAFDSFYNIIKDHFTALETRESFCAALTSATLPKSGATLLKKLLTKPNGQKLLTLLMLENEDFKRVFRELLNKFQEKQWKNQEGLDVASAQFYHLCQHDHRPVAKLPSELSYDEMIHFLKNYITDQKIASNTSSELTKPENFADFDDRFASVRAAAKQPKLANKMDLNVSALLYSEIRLLQKITSMILFENKGLPQNLALQFMAALLAITHLYKNQSILFPIEHIKLDNFSVVVINRTLYLEPYHLASYQDALILDETFTLTPFCDLPTTHPFKLMVSHGDPKSFKVDRPLETLFKIQATQKANTSDKEVISQFYTKIYNDTLLPLLLMQAAPISDTLASMIISIPSHLTNPSAINRYNCLVTIFNECSFQTLKVILLQTPYNGSSLFEHMLKLDAGAIFINLFKTKDFGIKLLMLLKEQLHSIKDKSLFVYELLLQSKEGLTFLGNILSYLEKQKTNIQITLMYDWYRWLTHTYSPFIKELIIRRDNFKIKNDALSNFDKHLIEQIDDWLFAMPLSHKVSNTPLIYILLQPEFRDLNLISLKTWGKIYQSIVTDASLLVTSFIDAFGNTTTILREMAIYRSNQELFNFINCSSEVLADLINETILFATPNNNGDIRQSLFGYLIHQSSSCLLIFNIFAHHPEYFNDLIVRLRPESRDQGVYDFLSETVYGRHFLRILHLGFHDEFFIKKEVVQNYVNAIALCQPRELREKYVSKQPNYNELVTTLEDKFERLQTYKEAKNWDLDLLHEQYVKFSESRAAIISAFASLRTATDRTSCYKEIGHIIAYAVSRYVAPFSLDYEIKLAQVSTKEWIIFFNPTLSYAESETNGQVQEGYLAYIVDEHRLLVDNEIQAYLNAKTRNRTPIITAWSSHTGLNYLRYFMEKKMSLFKEGTEIFATLKDIHQLIMTDFICDSLFDTEPKSSEKYNPHRFMRPDSTSSGPDRKPTSRASKN